MSEPVTVDERYWLIYHYRERKADKRVRRQYLQGFTATSGMPSWGSKSKAIRYHTKDAVREAWTQCNHLCNNPGDIHYQKVIAKINVVS